MQIRYPSFYHDFRCLAGSCPDSCCQEWAVVVDPDSAARYQALAGDLGDALRAAMAREDGDTILTITPDGRCPMWRADGLCRIQAELGEEALCHTCRQFPRLRHDYGDFVELGLELSCPEAARLLLTQPYTLLSRQAPGGDAPEYDPQDMALLLDTRATALALVDDPAYSPGQALAILLLYGYHVQSALDGAAQTPFSPEKALVDARSIAAAPAIGQLLDFFRSLEILTDAWRRQLEAPKGSPWAPAHRALARYFIHRYWLQAVSDLDLVGRVKLCVVSCLAIKALGGPPAETAQRYSKEIENDPDNVEALLDGAYTAPALADVALLGALLED